MSIVHQSSPAVSSIDFPFEGELIISPHYSVRVTASEARAVEVSIDAGAWKPCRKADAYWYYDWTGYAPGAHVVCVRVTHQDGEQETLRPRALRVAFQPQGTTGLQLPAVAEPSGIDRALWVLRNQKVEFVQLWFTDIGGKPWRICLPIEHITEEAFTAGITLDGPSTSLSFKSYINLLPDPAAIFKDPLATIPTAAIICDLVEPTDVGAGLGVRQVLRSAVDALSKLEPGLRATVGAEPEFYLLEQDGTPVPEEDLWDFVEDLCGTLQQAGIKSEGFRFGPAKGQGRVQMRWTDPVRTADHVILYRWFARLLARRRGKKLSFQAQPAQTSGAVTMPMHHSLWLGVENAFHDPNGWQQTSERCLHYAGGIVEHAAAISALVAPTIGSYPLRCGSQQSTLKPMLSATSTEALCRVPERQLHSGGRRVKFRAGNADANPYLALAATILAGVDGMARKIEAPIDSPKHQMPTSLDESLLALNADRGFLLAGGFTDRLIDAWISERRGRPDRSALEG
jgi:glutamine synthetase